MNVNLERFSRDLSDLTTCEVRYAVHGCPYSTHQTLQWRRSPALG